MFKVYTGTVYYVILHVIMYGRPVYIVSAYYIFKQHCDRLLNAVLRTYIYYNCIFIEIKLLAI